MSTSDSTLSLVVVSKWTTCVGQDPLSIGGKGGWGLSVWLNRNTL